MTATPITIGKSQWAAAGVVLSLAGGLGAWAVAQNQAHARWSRMNEPRSLCEVLNDRNRVEGETLMIRGTYYSALEQSSLRCEGCAESGKTWVEFEKEAWPSEPESVPGSGFKPGLIANVVVVGTLQSQGGEFGHLGQYKNLLRVERVVETELLLGRATSVPDLGARACKQ